MKKTPGMLYNEEEPDGLMFHNDEQYDKALEDGWVESPKYIGWDPKDIPKPPKDPDTYEEIISGLVDDLRKAESEIGKLKEKLKKSDNKNKELDKFIKELEAQMDS